jgi:tRNA A-37 threonylcarbamoyl transferase component Bud32
MIKKSDEEKIVLYFKNTYNCSISSYKLISNLDSAVYLLKTDNNMSFILKYLTDDEDVLYAELLGYELFSPFVDVAEILYQSENFIIKKFIDGVFLDEVDDNIKPKIFERYGKLVNKIHNMHTEFNYCGFVSEKTAKADRTFKKWYKQIISKKLTKITEKNLLIDDTSQKLNRYLDKYKHFLDDTNLFVIHNDLEDHNTMYFENKLILIDLDGLAVFPHEMDLSKIYLDHYKDGLFNSFLEGYGEVNIEKVKFCAVLKMISLIESNPSKNRMRKILDDRLPIFHSIIEEC